MAEVSAQAAHAHPWYRNVECQLPTPSGPCYSVFRPEGVFATDVQSVTNRPRSELQAASLAAADFVIFTYGLLGLLKISWAVFVLAITVTGYRRGEQWAWYTLWSVPVLLVSNALFSALFTGDGSQTLQFIPITTLTLLGLLLPYRQFFPR